MERLSLPQVTLCAVTSVALPETIAALARCADQIEFHAVKLFTDKVVAAPAEFSVVKIKALETRDDYSQFLIEELVNEIDSEYVLIVQWDSFVLHPGAWTDEFLEFDYIGAPWPQFDDPYRVGNGGFSLRSRKLLDACSRIGRELSGAEDVAICRTHRARLEQDFGICFASAALAARFAFERTASNGREFGFHGVFNMPDVLGMTIFARLYRSIDKFLINRRDHNFLLRHALRRFWQPGAMSVIFSYLKHRYCSNHGKQARPIRRI